MDPKRAFLDGWKGRIGLVATAPGNATEAEFNKYRPEGVAVLTTRTPLTSSTPGGILQMNKYIEDAAKMLAQNAYADVVLLSSTAGSFVNGRKFEIEENRRLTKLTGTKVISSCDCLLKALHSFNVKKITLITPSSENLNDVEIAYLYECGITVTALGGFFYSDPADILKTTPQDVYSLVRKTDVKESEAVVISCTGLQVMNILEDLEANLVKPVISSNQFGLWGALREIGVNEKISGIGSLFNN